MRRISFLIESLYLPHKVRPSRQEHQSYGSTAALIETGGLLYALIR